MRTLTVRLKVPWSEKRALRLLNFIARVNARHLRAHPELPLLYDSGVVYRREDGETWQAYPQLLAQGHEDCDSLATARAGELLARGHRALSPGDGGYDEAARRKLPRIRAEVFLKTRAPEGEVGALYHCVVRYRVAGRWFEDDPSARLGMYGGRVSPAQKARWAKAGVLR